MVSSTANNSATSTSRKTDWLLHKSGKNGLAGSAGARRDAFVLLVGALLLEACELLMRVFFNQCLNKPLGYIMRGLRAKVGYLLAPKRVAY